jgi:hypothetical protein
MRRFERELAQWTTFSIRKLLLGSDPIPLSKMDFGWSTVLVEDFQLDEVVC